MSDSNDSSDSAGIAQRAEQDMNTYQKKVGQSEGLTGDSVTESGVDDSVEQKFDGAQVKYGSAASGQGDNRDIPEDEGGDVIGGRTTKARDFEGEGGPEDKAARYAEENPGSDDIRGNIRN